MVTEIVLMKDDHCIGQACTYLYLSEILNDGISSQKAVSSQTNLFSRL